MPKLMILVPTLVGREAQRDRLYSVFEKQITEIPNMELNEVQVVYLKDNKQMTTGAKRNELIQMAVRANAEYIAFFDDDDLPSANYIKHQLDVARSGKDCGSFVGQIYFNGVAGNPFLHSIKYDHAYQDEKFYYRPPNHLNCMKLANIKDVRFEDKTFGEDMCWAMEIVKNNLLKTEYIIEENIYHYFNGKKNTPIETEIYNQIMQ